MASTTLAHYPLKKGFPLTDEKRIKCPKHKITFLNPPTKRRRFHGIDKNAVKPKDIPISLPFKRASKRVRNEILSAKPKWPAKFLKSSSDNKHKKIYTPNEVEEILGTVTAEVYEEIERRLSFEFEMVLRQQLDEQLRQFRQFSRENTACSKVEHSLKYIS